MGFTETGPITPGKPPANLIPPVHIYRRQFGTPSEHRSPVSASGGPQRRDQVEPTGVHELDHHGPGGDVGICHLRQVRVDPGAQCQPDLFAGVGVAAVDQDAQSHNRDASRGTWRRRRQTRAWSTAAGSFRRDCRAMTPMVGREKKTAPRLLRRGTDVVACATVAAVARGCAGHRSRRWARDAK